MGAIKIKGATSGSTTITAPDTGSDETIELSTALASKVDYALTANAQAGTGASAYTFALADASRLTTATGTSAKTFTIPPQTSVTWVANSIIRVANYGAGDLTIAGGSGVTVTNATKTLAQYESAALVRTGSNAWTLIPFSGGAGNADFSNAATGTYTDGGISYKYLTFTASGTLTITKAGFADVLVVGGGGGGGTFGAGGGGAGGHLEISSVYLSAATHTVTVGAGGNGATAQAAWRISGANGVASRLGPYYAVGGGAGGGDYGGAGSEGIGFTGGSGGGGGGGGTSGTGTPGQGNDGGAGGASTGGGGGGASATGAAGGANPGNGGNGTANSYTGSSVTRAGGGGGGSQIGGTPGTGGTGGGGAGSVNNTAATNGTANTGGGGGGGGYASNPGGNGGAGGSGIVIIRVAV